MNEKANVRWEERRAWEESKAERAEQDAAVRSIARRCPGKI